MAQEKPYNLAPFKQGTDDGVFVDARKFDKEPDEELLSAIQQLDGFAEFLGVPAGAGSEYMIRVRFGGVGYYDDFVLAIIGLMDEFVTRRS